MIMLGAVLLCLLASLVAITIYIRRQGPLEFLRKTTVRKEYSGYEYGTHGWPNKVTTTTRSIVIDLGRYADDRTP